MVPICRHVDKSAVQEARKPRDSMTAGASHAPVLISAAVLAGGTGSHLAN